MTELRAPNLLVVFEVKGIAITVLIDVADFSRGGVPSWEQAYIESIKRYADLLNLPLLIALKYTTIWALFEVKHLKKKDNHFTIYPTKAIEESLLGILAGDFGFSFRPGVSLNIKIRKEMGAQNGGIRGTIEEAYFLSPEGEKHTGAGGIMQLFTCTEQKSCIQENDTHVLQRFVIMTDKAVEFAHRALVTLLMTFGQRDVIDWHHFLIRKQLPLLSISPQEAVGNGLKAGFIQEKIDQQPKTIPSFISKSNGMGR